MARHDDQAMLQAWQHGRDDARANKPENPLLDLLPTRDERDAYRAGYQAEKKRIDNKASRD